MAGWVVKKFLIFRYSERGLCARAIILKPNYERSVKIKFLFQTVIVELTRELQLNYYDIIHEQRPM